MKKAFLLTSRSQTEFGNEKNEKNEKKRKREGGLEI
jgi:hypothetical protein